MERVGTLIDNLKEQFIQEPAPDKILPLVLKLLMEVKQLMPQADDLQKNYQEAAVKDLKKAIGVNDRYLFINELFRGDEIMYERSLKTINNFSIFPEANYWIQRELKVKLGWNERSEAVNHFNQLVRRRFASI